MFRCLDLTHTEISFVTTSTSWDETDCCIQYNAVHSLVRCGYLGLPPGLVGGENVRPGPLLVALVGENERDGLPRHPQRRAHDKVDEADLGLRHHRVLPASKGGQGPVDYQLLCSSYTFYFILPASLLPSPNFKSLSVLSLQALFLYLRASIPRLRASILYLFSVSKLYSLSPSFYSPSPSFFSPSPSFYFPYPSFYSSSPSIYPPSPSF